MGRWLPQRGWSGHDGLSRHLNRLNRLTLPTVPSGAIQERMLAKPEGRRGVGSALARHRLCLTTPEFPPPCAYVTSVL